MTTQLTGNIRAELARRRIPHYVLAREIGMDDASLSLRMTGVREFRASEVEQIARYLGVTVGALFGEPTP